MTLNTRIQKTLAKFGPLSVAELAETIGDYPVPSVRRTVREMEHASVIEHNGEFRPLRFRLA